MSLIDQTVSNQTKSLWHQRAFLLLWIASSTGYLARFVVRLALPLVVIWLTTSRLGVCVLLAGAALLGLLSLLALYAAALLLGISETLTETATTAFTSLLISHSQLEQANMCLLDVQKEALLLILHLLFKQVERKDFSWSIELSHIAVCS